MVHGEERVIKLQSVIDRTVQIREVMAKCIKSDITMGHWVYNIEFM